MKRALAVLTAPLALIGRVAHAVLLLVAAAPRETLTLLALCAFIACAVIGAVILRGAGVGLIVGAICALVFAVLFGLEDDRPAKP